MSNELNILQTEQREEKTEIKGNELKILVQEAVESELQRRLPRTEEEKKRDYYSNRIFENSDYAFFLSGGFQYIYLCNTSGFLYFRF